LGPCVTASTSSSSIATSRLLVVSTMLCGGYGGQNNYFTEMCSGSEEGSYLRLIESQKEGEEEGLGVVNKDLSLPGQGTLSWRILWTQSSTMRNNRWTMHLTMIIDGHIIK